MYRPVLAEMVAALLTPINPQELLFYMRQQKFLELLEVKDITKALSVLRTELTPLNQSEDKLHSLAR